MTEILAKALPSLLQVTVVGLLLGAGLPALFALGLKCFSLGRAVSADGTEYKTGAGALGRGLGTGIFALIVAAALFGIAVIVFGNQIFGGH